MSAPRFKLRNAHATIANFVTTELAALGWVTAPINFSATPVTVIDFQPDERGIEILKNTVAVSIGDVDDDTDEELGAATGGLWSLYVPTFVDVYMEKQSLSVAICDDIRDIFFNQETNLINQATGVAVTGATIQFDQVIGPHGPTGAPNDFRRYWRIMRIGSRIFYQS